MKKILIYGGSFNPLHNGHDAIIRFCATQEEYDAVWVMPSASRIDKPDLLSDSMRLDMLRHYRESLPNSIAQFVTVSNFEIALGAPSETLRTHTALQAQYPDCSFTYIFGADSALDMVNWRGGAKLQKLLDILIVPRSGYESAECCRGRYIDLADSHKVSSTAIRKLRKNRQSIAHCVPSAVHNYIKEHCLYE